MKNKVSKKLLRVCENNDWYVVGPDKQNGWELEKYSPEGEDFWFYITARNDEEFIKAVQEYAEDFDPEEHASMWYGANKGEPTSLRALLDDADAIQAMMRELGDELYTTSDDDYGFSCPFDKKCPHAKECAHAFNEERYWECRSMTQDGVEAPKAENKKK